MTFIVMLGGVLCARRTKSRGGRTDFCEYTGDLVHYGETKALKIPVSLCVF